jgi:excinuclease UvrABC helicase subunit UvrB
MRSNGQTKIQRLEENYEQDKKMLAKTGDRGAFDTGPERETAYIHGRSESIPLWKAADYFVDDVLKQIDDIIL